MNTENNNAKADFNDIAGCYMKLAGSDKRLTREEEQQLARATHMGDRKARHQLILRNMGLVYKEVNKHRNFIKNMEIPDLTLEGVFGLDRAVDKFDPDRGTRFSTCATWWIRQAIGRAIDDQERTIRIPVHMCEKMHKVDRAISVAQRDDGVGADYRQVCRKLKVNSADYVHANQADKVLPFSVPAGDDDSGALEGSIADAVTPSTEKAMLKEANREELWRRFASLEPLEVQIMDLTYGIFREALPTDWAIAHKLSLHQKQVPEIRGRALGKLRRMDWSDVLEDLPCGA